MIRQLELMGGLAIQSIRASIKFICCQALDYLLARTQLTAVFGTTTSGDDVYTAEGFISSVENTADMESPASYSGSITLTGSITKSTNA